MVGHSRKTSKTQNNNDDIPRSMKPVIPEPKHRVAPKGVSSGISFRNLPSPSLNTIRKICDHYESKCTGKYKSLASRYVIQMSQEIRNQIEGIQRQTHRPQHFTFEESIRDVFDRNFYCQSDKSCQRRDENNVDTNFNDIKNVDNQFSNDSSKRNHTHIDTISLERRIQKLENSLLEKKIEMRGQEEKAKKDLEYIEKQYKEKIQVDQLHFEHSQRSLQKAHEDEIRKLKKEITQIKSDARLVIDFIRRKANEAIAEENSKVKHQKKSIGKRMEALEAEMKKTFHNHLKSLEEEVKNVVQKERNKTVDLKILPPPPPKNISILHKRRPHSFSFRRIDDSIPSTEETKAPANKCSDDSISTCYSDNMFPSDFLTKNKDSVCTNEHEVLRNRVKELEQWTDSLTLALRSGAKIIRSPCMSR